MEKGESNFRLTFKTKGLRGSAPPLLTLPAVDSACPNVPSETLVFSKETRNNKKT